MQPKQEVSPNTGSHLTATSSEPHLMGTCPTCSAGGSQRHAGKRCQAGAPAQRTRTSASSQPGLGPAAGYRACAGSSWRVARTLVTTPRLPQRTCVCWPQGGTWGFSRVSKPLCASSGANQAAQRRNLRLSPEQTYMYIWWTYFDWSQNSNGNIVFFMSMYEQEQHSGNHITHPHPVSKH